MPRQTGLHHFPGNAGARICLGLGATLFQFSKMPLWNDGIDIGVNDAVPEKTNEFETLGGVETFDVELLQGRTHDCLQREYSLTVNGLPSYVNNSDSRVRGTPKLRRRARKDGALSAVSNWRTA